jgi:hypothetical protein
LNNNVRVGTPGDYLLDPHGLKHPLTENHCRAAGSRVAVDYEGSKRKFTITIITMTGSSDRSNISDTSLRSIGLLK